MKTYKTLFVERFVGYKMIEAPVLVDAHDISEARRKFARMARELNRHWSTKKVTLVANN